MRQLHLQSRLTIRTLRRIIDYWLERVIPPIGDLSSCRHAVVDSTYIHGRRCAVTVVMDATTNTVIAGQYGLHESHRAMADFCAALAAHGLSPRSITTDGQPKLLAHLRAQWPQTVLQRCLIHIQRQGLVWCRQRPTRTDAQHLRRLYGALAAIRTPQARDRWLDQLVAWEQRYGWRIELTPEHGYVFSDLKRARSLLAHALTDMFHYLEDPEIVYHTNGIEGYFSRLKTRYRQHRGLSQRHEQSFFEWYLHLSPR